VGWSAAPLSASAFAASTITPEAAETREPPPSLSPVVPFDDGENNGFIFDGNDGQGTSDQELGEDQNIVTADTLPLRRRESAESVWPVRPMVVEVAIPSKRATPPPSFPVVSFDDGEGRGFLFGQNNGRDASDQEPGEDEDAIVVDTSPLRRREPAEGSSPVGNLLYSVEWYVCLRVG
jgi:hypothetical protein